MKLADETTSVNASASPSTTVQPAEPTSTTPPVATPPKQTSSAAPQPGQQPELSAEERIKRFQQQTSQTLRQKEIQFQQERAQMQQQMAALKQQLVNVQAQGMDETDAELFKRDQYIQNLQAEIAQRDQYAAQVQADMRTNQALFRMSSKTGVPFEELQQKFWETGDADGVWEYAHEQSVKKLTAPQIAAGEKAAQQLAAAQEKAEEEAAIEKEKPVDLGTGASASAIPPHVRATRNKDAPGFVLAYLNGQEQKAAKR
jgi:hypothetical protein